MTQSASALLHSFLFFHTIEFGKKYSRAAEYSTSKKPPLFTFNFAFLVVFQLQDNSEIRYLN